MIGATDSMGLALRLAASSNRISIQTLKDLSGMNILKVMDIDVMSGKGKVHMWSQSKSINARWFWMGPFIVSAFDPDCLDIATWIKTPTCAMQPHRLLNGGTPLCLTLGDGRASDKATTATNTACPNNNAADGSVSLTSGVCQGARTYIATCDFGAGSNLWQQWKIKDSSKGRIQSMACRLLKRLPGLRCGWR